MELIAETPTVPAGNKAVIILLCNLAEGKGGYSYQAWLSYDPAVAQFESQADIIIPPPVDLYGGILRHYDNQQGIINLMGVVNRPAGYGPFYGQTVLAIMTPRAVARGQFRIAWREHEPASLVGGTDGRQILPMKLIDSPLIDVL